MPDLTTGLTPQRWTIVKDVLTGVQGERTSRYAACKAAGMTVAELNDWIKISREGGLDVEPWVQEIAPFFDALPHTQADVLFGIAWERAVYGVKTPIVYKGHVVDSYMKLDNTMLLRLLEKLDPSFRAAANLKLGEGANGGDLDEEGMIRLAQSFAAYMKMQKLKADRGEPVDITPPTPAIVGPPISPPTDVAL